jgi:hypothetical protein
MPRSSKWSPSFRFSGLILLCISHPSNASYTPRPFHPPWFDHPNNKWWRIQMMNVRTTDSVHVWLLTLSLSRQLAQCLSWQLTVFLYDYWHCVSPDNWPNVYPDNWQRFCMFTDIVCLLTIGTMSILTSDSVSVRLLTLSLLPFGTMSVLTTDIVSVWLLTLCLSWQLS